MTTMVAEIYEALREAGASEEKSKKAAQAVADYNEQFSCIKAELLVMKWMLGTILAGIIALILRAYF
jgi:hypothetical protein